METETIETSDGARLDQMLSCYRKFLESVYALMRYLEAELTKREWELVRNGGYAVSRNGLGAGLANFAKADWLPTQIGIAFVRPGLAVPVAGTTNTQIPAEGLEVLFFQVRWLDKSPGEPAVWYGKLTVVPEGPGQVKKWEEYQNQVLRVLEAENSSRRTGRIKEFKMGPSGTAITVTGEFTPVPLTELRNEQDIFNMLVSPIVSW